MTKMNLIKDIKNENQVSTVELLVTLSFLIALLGVFSYTLSV